MGKLIHMEKSYSIHKTFVTNGIVLDKTLKSYGKSKQIILPSKPFVMLTKIIRNVVQSEIYLIKTSEQVKVNLIHATRIAFNSAQWCYPNIY